MMGRRPSAASPFGQAPAGQSAPLLVVRLAYRSTATVFGGAARWIPAGPPAPSPTAGPRARGSTSPVPPAFDRAAPPWPPAPCVARPQATSSDRPAPTRPLFRPPAPPLCARGLPRTHGRRRPRARRETATADRWWSIMPIAALGSAVAVLDFDGDGRLDRRRRPLARASGTDMIARASPRSPTPPPTRAGPERRDRRYCRHCVPRRPRPRARLPPGHGRRAARALLAIPRETVLPAGTPSGATNIVTARRGGFGLQPAPAGDVNGDGSGDPSPSAARAAPTTAPGGARPAPTSMGASPPCAPTPRPRPTCPAHRRRQPRRRRRGRRRPRRRRLRGDGDLALGAGARGSRSSMASARVAGATTSRPRASWSCPTTVPCAPTTSRPATRRALSAQRNNDWVDLPGANTGMGLVLAGGVDLTGDRARRGRAARRGASGAT